MNQLKKDGMKVCITLACLFLFLVPTAQTSERTSEIGDEPSSASEDFIITPQPGDYLMYEFLQYEDGALLGRGFYNITFSDVGDPALINASVILDGIVYSYLVVNKTTREVIESDAYDEDEYFPFWYNPTLKLGDKVKFLNSNTTISNESQINALGKNYDCWFFNGTTDYGTEMEVFYDKNSGIPIQMKEIATSGSAFLTLNKSNISALQDYSSPIWDQDPENQQMVEGIALNYDLNASDDFSIDTYSVNDTFRFSIDDQGVLTNATILPTGIYYLEVSVNDTSGNEITKTLSISVIEDEEELNDDAEDESNDNEETNEDPNDNSTDQEDISNFSEQIPGYPLLVFGILTLVSIIAIIRRKKD